MPRYKKSIRQRFHTKYIITTSGCWSWEGALRADGYGILKINGRCDGAHRYSYMIYKGEIPKGLDVLHTCDNSKCVNPSHLFLGTKHTNMVDKINKGRHRVPYNAFTIGKIAKGCNLNFSNYYDYIKDFLETYLFYNQQSTITEDDIKIIILKINSI